jgi:acetyltransferase
MPSRDEIRVMPDGTRIRLRPIRPDDGPTLRDIVEHLTAEDLRLRFFAPVKQLSPALVERLTHLDPEREVAIVATLADTGEPAAVGRLAGGESGEEVEYALTVRSDLKGHGIGYFLLGRLIEVARQKGYRRIIGLVLRENERMLQMTREYGFHVAEEDSEPCVLRVTLDLAAMPAAAP